MKTPNSIINMRFAKYQRVKFNLYYLSGSNTATGQGMIIAKLFIAKRVYRIDRSGFNRLPTYCEPRNEQGSKT